MEKIVNINEQILKEKLAAKLVAPENTEYCACDSCIYDMLTYALNKMPVNYVATEGGKIIRRHVIEEQHVDFETAVQEAILVVGKAPRHEEPRHVEFINITETNVKERLEPILKSEGGCSCMKCYNDILCIACNDLPPRYTDSIDGDIYERINAYDRNAKGNIDEAINHAIKIVRINPRH